FDVDHRINKMLALQRTKAILPAKTGEESAVIEGGLPVEIEFRRPPGRGAVLELHPISMKVVAAALRPEGRKILDIQTSGFFEIVIVSDDVRTLLGKCKPAKEQERQRKRETGKPCVSFLKLFTVHWRAKGRLRIVRKINEIVYIGPEQSRIICKAKICQWDLPIGSKVQVNG